MTPPRAADPGPGAIITVFRSRRNEQAVSDYARYEAETAESLARHDGLLEFKTFTAEDGERLSLVIFDSIEHHRAWRDDAVHQRAQAAGRALLYDEFEILVSELQHRSHHRRSPEQNVATTVLEEPLA